MYMYILYSCRAIKRNGLVSDYKLSSVTHIDTKNMRIQGKEWKLEDVLPDYCIINLINSKQNELS